MATTARTSLSAEGLGLPKPTPKSTNDYRGLSCPPHIDRLEKKSHKAAVIEALSIDVDEGPDGFVSGFLHMPPDFVNPAPTTHHRTAAILLSGAGGGVTGPSSIYLSLACKLATLSTGIPTLRLDYRAPARNRYCVQDVRAAMAYLEDTYGLDRFVLVGWSFGGAPVFTVAGDDERVVGCATVASQTAETEGIRRLAPRPLLLLHGTADHTLSSTCSEKLYSMYGDRKHGRIHLFEGDNHVLSGNAQAAEAMLCDFITSCAGLRVGEGERDMVVEEELIQDGERASLMKRGGDLRTPETMD